MRVVNTRDHFNNIARVSAKRLAQGRDIELLVCVEGAITGTIAVENVDRINDTAAILRVEIRALPAHDLRHLAMKRVLRERMPDRGFLA